MVLLEKTLEGPLDYKEIQPVNPKEDQSWMFIGRTDVEAETPMLWPPDVKSWFIGKDPDAGKDWRQEEKGTTEDEMVGWHHQLGGHEFEQALGVGEGQGGLVCCGLWGLKEWDTTEWLNWRIWKCFLKFCLCNISQLYIQSHLQRPLLWSPELCHHFRPCESDSRLLQPILHVAEGSF